MLPLRSRADRAGRTERPRYATAGSQQSRGQQGAARKPRQPAGRVRPSAAVRRMANGWSHPIAAGTSYRRLRIGLVVVLLLFVAVVGRLVYIQSADASAWAAEAKDSREISVKLNAPRAGSIVDRNGAVLATSVQAKAIFADPGEVDHVPGTPANKLVPGLAEATAAKLAGVLGVPEQTLLAKMTKKTNTTTGKAIRFVFLAHRLDPAVANVVTSMNLPGIGTQDEKRRDEPGHDLAANIIGFTNSEGVGAAGLESSFNKVLAGQDGQHTYEADQSGIQIPAGYDKTVPARPGTGIKLTIDNDVQYQAQQIIAQQTRAAGGSFGTAVVLDVKTGQVLADASYPAYDAANPGDSNPTTWRDVATQTVVEPGSVHKAITIGAGLQTGVIQPDTVLDLPGSITKGGVRFTDTHSHGQVKMTLQGILTQSSNIGTITVADKLGAQRLYDFQKAFGLGASDDLGLPGESSGIVQPVKNWSGPSYGGIPIGLGVAVTPMQMASVYQTIANNGVRVQPSLVSGTIAPDGTYVPKAAPKQTRVLSPENAAAMRWLLEGVATQEGTAPAAAIDGYRVAGKTGTGGQVAGNHYESGNVTSFVGMAPADAPRYVVAIFVKVPDKAEGGPIAGPAFHDLMSFVLRHEAIPPTGSVRPPLKIYG
ncbi:peptidoglycan D,D-transpeptidase FtsI family protein [Fodinicola feengrottensis]|uniref:peptidoglycan D,D-transpeptidase FtsI family protein n=1 Tax=Fodinicola feengrottensis TaxID=435914 RepID=UPI0013D7C25C|nr:penicillin-binding protein 2 [Fodinicola feengrottensis]